MDEQDPAKRVVKRVVKKTVVRPAAPAQAPPTVRYGRPVATATKPQAKAAPKPASKPGTKAPAAPVRSGAPVPRQKVARQRPSLDIGAKVAGAGELTGRAWWAVADRTADGAHATGTFVAARARAVRAYRLPHLNPYLASVITGAVVGLVAVVLGIGTLAIFEAVRGVSSGGGLWGGLTFTVVAVIGVFLGESLLRGFGTHGARVTSFLAVMLSIIAMLGLLLDLVDGVAGLVLIPLLGVAGYVVAHWLVDLAENTPAVVE